MKSICKISLAALLLCSAPAFAGPTFESVTFGKQSTRCDESNTSRTINLLPAVDTVKLAAKVRSY